MHYETVFEIMPVRNLKVVEDFIKRPVIRFNWFAVRRENKLRAVAILFSLLDDFNRSRLYNESHWSGSLITIIKEMNSFLYV